MLLDAAESLVLLPAETAASSGLREFANLAAEPPILLLARSRAVRLAAFSASARLLPTSPVVALALGQDWMDPIALNALADPTSEQLFHKPLRLAASSPPAALAALELAKLVHLLPAMLSARVGPDARAKADEMGLLSVSDTDVAAAADYVAISLRRVAEASVPLEDAADARVVVFRAPESGAEHLAILIGPAETSEAPLVRLHSQCFTGDVLGSLRCDCGPQLHGAIRRMAAEGAGVLLYLDQEGRGIGLVNKLRAYALQDRGLDTLDANHALGWDADERDFRIAATMLRDLGIGRVRLLTNNPEKLAALAACGVTVERESLAFPPNGVNDAYLAAKVARFGHLLR